MSERSSSVPLIVRAAMSASMSNAALACYEWPPYARPAHRLRPAAAGQARRRRRPPRRRRPHASRTPSSSAVTNQLAHVLRDHGVGPGVKVVWCGQNSMGVVDLVVAARKLGATAVPLNYRLSDEEAAYVTDHSDATVVYVDAELAPMFERIRGRDPEGRRRPRVRRRRRPTGWSPSTSSLAAAPTDAAGPTGRRGRRPGRR